jgi:hypothetical protein
LRVESALCCCINSFLRQLNVEDSIIYDSLDYRRKVPQALKHPRRKVQKKVLAYKAKRRHVRQKHQKILTLLELFVAI